MVEDKFILGSSDTIVGTGVLAILWNAIYYDPNIVPGELQWTTLGRPF